MNMRWTSAQRAFQLSALLVGLTVVLGASQAPASSLATISPAANDRLDRETVRAASNLEQRAEMRVVYDPSRVYGGVYASDQVYRRVQGSERWAGSRHPARVREVTCREARSALERVGAWTGQLNANGSCSSGEPTEWVTGNLLNFRAGLYEEERAL